MGSLTSRPSLAPGYGEYPPVFYAPLAHNIWGGANLKVPTFARPGAALYTDPETGLIKSAGVNIPRFEEAGGLRALLLEPQVVNRCHDSQAFRAAISGWTNTNCTVTDDATTAPDGNDTADKIVEAADVASIHGIKDDIAEGEWSDDVKICFPVYAKQAERTWMKLSMRTKENAWVGASFNLATGEIGTEGVDAVGIQAAANGFYRCWIINDIGNGVTDTVFQIDIAEADNDTTYDGNGTSGIYVWQADITECPGVTTPIYTSGVSAARSSDAGYPRWALPGDLFGPTIPNRITSNSDFEDGFTAGLADSWIKWQNLQTYTDDAVILHGGAHAQRVTVAAGGDAQACGVQHTIPVVAGEYYKITAWVYCNEIATVTMKVTTMFSPGSSNTVVPATTWTQIELLGMATYTGNLMFQVYRSAADSDVGDYIVIDDVVDALQTPPVTVTMWARFGYANTDVPGFHGILSANDAGNNLIYISGAGKFASYDGANAAYDNGAGFSAHTWYKLVLRFSVTTGKYRIGVDSGAGVVWGTEENFDGAFSMGNYLRLAYGINAGPVWVRELKVYDRILTDPEINALGSP